MEPYACLTKRIPTSRLCCRDFRVRSRGETALVQVSSEQMGLVEERRGQILEKLRELGSKDAALNLQSR